MVAEEMVHTMYTTGAHDGIGMDPTGVDAWKAVFIK